MQLVLCATPPVVVCLSVSLVFLLMFIGFAQLSVLLRTFCSLSETWLEEQMALRFLVWFSTGNLSCHGGSEPTSNTWFLRPV